MLNISNYSNKYDTMIAFLASDDAKQAEKRVDEIMITLNGTKADVLPVLEGVITKLQANSSHGELKALVDKVAAIRLQVEGCVDGARVTIDKEKVHVTLDATCVEHMVRGLAQKSKRVKMHLSAAGKEQSQDKRVAEYTENLDRHVNSINKKYGVAVTREKLMEVVYQAGGDVLVEKMLKNEKFSKAEEATFLGVIRSVGLIRRYIQEVKDCIEDDGLKEQVTEGVLKEAIKQLPKGVQGKFLVTYLEPHEYRDLADAVEKVISRQKVAQHSMVSEEERAQNIQIERNLLGVRQAVLRLHRDTTSSPYEPVFEISTQKEKARMLDAADTLSKGLWNRKILESDLTEEECYALANAIIHRESVFGNSDLDELMDV